MMFICLFFLIIYFETLNMTWMNEYIEAETSYMKASIRVYGYC